MVEKKDLILLFSILYVKLLFSVSTFNKLCLLKFQTHKNIMKPQNMRETDYNLDYEDHPDNLLL